MSEKAKELGDEGEARDKLVYQLAGWSIINAVYNLFNYGEGLQNPELTIRRLSDAAGRGAIGCASFAARVRKVLMGRDVPCDD